MMQQPVYHQEQHGPQEQVGQQMVLCPVRVVYETQMLVQPGDQIHPNQTILINPQNPPPWIQNRQVQNQVIYVQHVPTNYVPSPQQQIDQNQLYIQNYSYQNIPQIQNVPQMYVQNPQEHIRPLQVVPNMIQNIPANINTIQSPRMVSHVAPMPQSVNIVNTPQNQINVNRMIAPNQVNPNEIINRSQETVTQTSNTYRHQIPQVIQDQRFQAQPTITMVPSNIPNTQRVPQAFESNINQIRPSQHVTANIHQTYANTIFHTDESKKITLPGNKGNNMNIVNPVSTVRLPQTYRPIQPRTNQIRSNAPTLMPVQSSSNQMQHLVPNMTAINAPRKILPNNSVTVINNVNTTLSNVKIEGNNLLFNRKRKSESPDEIHKKVSVSNQTDNPIIIKQVTNASYTNCADVGVNTSPLHRRSGKITINNLQITPIPPATTTNSKIITELAKPTRPNTTMTEAENSVKKISNQPSEIPAIDPLPSDKEKLIRNTVYVQARGRILTDKDNVPDMPKVETLPTDPDTNISLPSNQAHQEVKKEISMPVIETKHVTNPSVCKSADNGSKSNIKKEFTDALSTKVDTVKDKGLAKRVTDDFKSSKLGVTSKKESTLDIKLKEEVKSKDESTSDVKLKDESTSDVNLKDEPMADVKLKDEPMADVKSKDESMADVKLKDEPMADVKKEEDNKTKEERGFILTHVLGGFVIQESNIAFPIRKPLKEKILYSNTDDMRREKERPHAGLSMRDNSKILDISHLNIAECENMEGEISQNNDKENPFTLLKPCEVKSWSAEQLATHLAKYDWTDTVSVLQEHELDGESLLLVSKAQLVTIGVKDEHAEIITDFVRS